MVTDGSLVSVCIASIIRAPYLMDVVTVDPQSYPIPRASQPQLTATPPSTPGTAVNASIWSVIEPGVGIICASLPSMGPILRKAFPIDNGLKPRKISLLTFTKNTDDPETCRQPGGDYSSECLSNSVRAGQSLSTAASTPRGQSCAEESIVAR
ncbi:MAG: hypothetical protein Q9207_001267 [Kuettlingeria erythrocarpa]